MMPQSWIGKQIGGRYQIESLLGQGGMSAVYRATDPNLRRLVAIKVIHAHLSIDPNFIGRFKEEAAAVARLRHPNIVQVHDFNIDGETYYMVMEYLVGETLQTRLRRLNDAGRRMPLNEVIRLCLQLCSAVGYAHEHELVHRDIKPANIMLNVNGQAILMDFGIVKIIGGDYHTATGATIGTAMYMPPEQIRSERIDDRADIYSLGVTLYEMISGRPPYMADSAMTLMMMVLNDPLPDLREIRTDVPEGLLDAVNKALAKDASDRFQSMVEMATALQQVQAELEGNKLASTVAMEEDKTRAAPLSPVTDTFMEGSTEDDVATLSEVSKPETATVSESLPQPDASFAASSGPQAAAPEAPPARQTHITSRGSLFTRLGSRRIILTITGVLVLAAVVTVGLMYLNSRRPPSAQLVPINSPANPLNAQSAHAVVNLGRWEMDSYIEELAFSPDGRLIGTTNNRDWLRFSRYRYFSGLLKVQEGSLQNYQLGHTAWVYDIAFSPDGQLFGSVSDDGTVLLWKVTDGSLVRKIESSHGGLTGLAFSPNNLLLAASSWDGVVSLWEVTSGNLLRTIQENEFSLKDVAFSPDGTLLAAPSDDNSVLVWRVSDSNLVYSLKEQAEPAYQVVFSPDGSLLISACEDSTIRIWQLSDGSLLHTLEAHSEPVYDVAFSPDGSLLASAGGDGKIHLWRVSDGSLLGTLADHSDSIKSVAFDPDGHFLTSAAADGVIQFWGISQAIPLGTP